MEMSSIKHSDCWLEEDANCAKDGEIKQNSTGSNGGQSIRADVLDVYTGAQLPDPALGDQLIHLRWMEEDQLTYLCLPLVLVRTYRMMFERW